MAGKSISKSLVWILLGLLILGLGGFGVTNLSGGLRSIGSVGDVDIDVNEYFNGLQNEIRALEAARGEAVSFAEARTLGISETVLSQLITSAAFDHEAAQLGLSIGDANLRDEILGMQQFRGIDGEFNRETYSFSLEHSGLTEGQFEENVRADTARSFLQAAVLAGVNLPGAYSDTLANYLGERRDVSWAVLERGDLSTGLPVPTDSDLTSYHTENAQLFTRPERKRITYAWLTPDMIIDTVQVDQQALRDAYDARIDEFNRPERRLVERLVFGTESDAQAALALIEAEDTSFEDLVAERGLELSDVDLGDVDRVALADAAGPVFDAQVGDVVGPLPSTLGPALFRINAILSKQVTSFEQAEPNLRAELAADRARRVVGARIESVDDLLAGGATIEDLAQETELEMGQIDWHAGMTDGIGAYDAFRAAAAAVTSGDYPDVAELEDGGIFALRLDEVVEPALQPLEEVRDAVQAAWEAQAIVDALNSQAEPLVSRLSSGESFDEVGLVVDGAQALTRRGFQADTPAAFIETVFSMEEGAATAIEGNSRIFVLKLDSIQPPDPEDEDLKQLQTLLQNQAANSLSQDLFQVLADDIRSRAGINLDQTAINAVHANFH